MLMLLFVYLFGGAIETGTEYVTYVVPGVIMLCAGFGSSLTAVAVTQDMNGGIMDRFRSMDVSGAAVLAGHVVASIARNLMSTVLVLAVAFLIGFRPHADPLALARRDRRAAAVRAGVLVALRGGRADRAVRRRRRAGSRSS